jgi:hypothetical protein
MVSDIQSCAQYSYQKRAIDMCPIRAADLKPGNRLEFPRQSESFAMCGGDTDRCRNDFEGDDTYRQKAYFRPGFLVV